MFIFGFCVWNERTVFVVLQEKREEYRRKEKERENEEIEKRLEAQREKVMT